MTHGPRLLAPDPAAWDSFLDRAEGATVFHTAAWARLWTTHWPGARWQALALEDGAGLLGALGFVTRSSPAGHRILSMPDGTYGGPLVRLGAPDPPGLRRKLLEAWARLVGGRGVFAAQLTWLAPANASSAREALAGEPGPPAGLEAEEGFTQVVPLTSDFGAALARMPHGVRARVRQAEESGLVLRPVHDEAGVRAYHELVVANARRHHGRPRPLGLYLGVLEHLVPAGLARFELVEHSSAVVGGSLHLLHRGRAVNWLTVADESRRRLHPSHRVIAHWLRERSAAGDREYDLGRSPAGAKGLIDFKASWGAVPRGVVTLRRRSLLHRLLRR